MRKKKILIVFGTRPEAIKMIPLIKACNEKSCFKLKVCLTGQHVQLVNPILKQFNITPDFVLKVMKNGQSLNQLISKIINRLDVVLNAFKPDLVLVHGDTSTALAAAISSFHNGIKVGHIEAGLRTDNLYSPWPEEANRRLISKITEFHFAPTSVAKNNLIKENVPPNKIFITGNTVVDALLIAVKLLNEDLLNKKYSKKFDFLDKDKEIILVTGHRRESFGKGFLEICNGLRQIALKFNNIQIVYPVHLNPNVQKPVKKILGSVKNIFLIPPQDYFSFVYLLDRCKFVLTDSGGIQEEAPSLNKYVLVMRENSERPEAIKNKTAKLVGTNAQNILNEVTILLKKKAHSQIRLINPYGKGDAAKKIVSLIDKKLSS